MIYVISGVYYGIGGVLEGPTIDIEEFEEIYNDYYNNLNLSCDKEESTQIVQEIWKQEGFNDKKYHECKTNKDFYAMNMMIKYHNFKKVEWKDI